MTDAVSKEDIEMIMELMTKHKVSLVEIGGIKIVKDIHEPSPIEESPQVPEESDEDLLFFSSN